MEIADALAETDKVSEDVMNHDSLTAVIHFIVGGDTQTLSSGLVDINNVVLVYELCLHESLG